MTNATPRAPLGEDPRTVLASLAAEAEQLEPEVRALAIASVDAIRAYEAQFDRDLTADELAPAARLLKALGALQAHAAVPGGGCVPDVPDWATAS